MKSTLEILPKVYIYKFGGIKRFINVSEIFMDLCPPVTLKMKSRSPKFKIKLALKLVPMSYQCMFGEIPSIGSRDMVHTRNWHQCTNAWDPD